MDLQHVPVPPPMYRGEQRRVLKPMIFTFSNHRIYRAVAYSGILHRTAVVLLPHLIVHSNGGLTLIISELPLPRFRRPTVLHIPHPMPAPPPTPTVCLAQQVLRTAALAWTLSTEAIPSPRSVADGGVVRAGAR